MGIICEWGGSFSDVICRLPEKEKPGEFCGKIGRIGKHFVVSPYTKYQLGRSWAKYTSELSVDLLKRIRELVFSQDFKERNRYADCDFVRNRCLTFPTLILFLANFLKGSLQDELDQFFQTVHGLAVALRVVTRSALSQARRKISHKAFIELLDVVCGCVNRHQGRLKTYRGMIVFAIDGSTLRLPSSAAIRQEFGSAKSQQGECSMARVSMLHDVLNRITYDAAISPYQTSEQDMAWQHLEEATLPDGSLILLDRGYNNFALLRTIRDQGHHFCVRLRGDLKIAKAFKKSGMKEVLTRFEPTKTALSQASADSPYRKAINVRLVRMTFGKEEYILMTSLTDSKAFPTIELFDLYHQRWQVEESYKVKKCRMKIEELSGKTPELVRQDFHAKVFAESLTMALALELNELVEGYSLTARNEYQISITQALAKMKNTLVLLFVRKNPLKILNDLLKILMKSLVAMVPGRKFRRRGQGRNLPKLQTQSFGYRCNR